MAEPKGPTKIYAQGAMGGERPTHVANRSKIVWFSIARRRFVGTVEGQLIAAPFFELLRFWYRRSEDAEAAKRQRQEQEDRQRNSGQRGVRFNRLGGVALIFLDLSKDETLHSPIRSVGEKIAARQKAWHEKAA